MKPLMLGLLIFIIGCGQNSEGGPSSLEVPEKVKWTISSTSQNFPENFRLILNGMEAVDTCHSREDVELTDDGYRTMVEFYFSWLPFRAFQVEIIDLGSECDNDAIFHSESDVVYGVLELGNGSEKDYSVSVNLNN